MNGLRFEVSSALLFLVILPAVAVVARRRSPSRLALGLRLAALALVITALASPSVVGRGGDLTIIFAVDRSASIAATQRQAAEEFVRSAAAQRRQGDRVGLVTFGADALVEEVPSGDPQLAFATQPAPHATDIGGAIQAALSALPSEGAGRIVLL
ncbi:MAG TPA: VWA domain-containing protein, partial [bacterium]|nr:VWA domain-containing protein [bacterium]